MKEAAASLCVVLLVSMPLWACREPSPDPTSHDEVETPEAPVEGLPPMPVDNDRTEDPPCTPTPTRIRVVNESGAPLTFNHADRFLFLRAEPVDGDESYHLEGSRPPLHVCPDQPSEVSGIEDHEDPRDRTAFVLAAGEERLLEWNGWFHLADRERDCFWRRAPTCGEYRFSACGGPFRPGWPRAGPCVATTVSVPASEEIVLRFAGPSP